MFMVRDINKFNSINIVDSSHFKKHLSMKKAGNLVKYKKN